MSPLSTGFMDLQCLSCNSWPINIYSFGSFSSSPDYHTDIDGTREQEERRKDGQEGENKRGRKGEEGRWGEISQIHCLTFVLIINILIIIVIVLPLETITP